MKKPLKTSESHPIRVDFLPEKLVGPGRLGLTFAPGKIDEGGWALWQRDLGADLARLRSEFGAEVLVTLLELHELERLQIADLFERARALGMETIWEPIPDGSVPGSREIFADLLRKILERLAAGRTVVVHCRGGLGRTGLVAAGALVARGLEPREAIRAVRRVRPMAIETEAQEQFVREGALAAPLGLLHR